MAVQARKNINQELKKTIFNSILFSFLTIMGSGIKIILIITFVFQNNDECVAFKLILWFSLMTVHDCIYILYIIMYILLSKFYLNQKRMQQSSDPHLNDSLELTILSHINEENNFGNNKTLSSSNEIALEMKIDKENMWFRWFKSLILW